MVNVSYSEEDPVVTALEDLKAKVRDAAFSSGGSGLHSLADTTGRSASGWRRKDSMKSSGNGHIEDSSSSN